MEVIFILIIISLLVAGGFLVAFIFNVRAGQYEDTYTPSIRILFEEDKEPPKEELRDQNPIDPNTQTKSTNDVRTT
jgi:cbb3-type cytochrome oxidase maturation protein